MAQGQSGTIRPFYGIIIRDKCKTADKNTLAAYKIVGEDILKDASGPDADDLRQALAELQKALDGK